MKKIICLLLLGITGSNCVIAQSARQTIFSSEKLHIIPEPVSVTVRKGEFKLKPDTRIIATDSKAGEVAAMLAESLNKPTGYQLKININNTHRTGNDILLKINTTSDTTLGNEGYRLLVSKDHVIISANKPNGLFYGMQTLLQLLPPAIESHVSVKNVSWNIPCVDIKDYPRFVWRGLMLDVSRHFFSKEFVKRYIDEMAKYKFNVFHWHLTDDPGWRIEIKGLPRLTGIGAWRGPRNGPSAGFGFAAHTPEEVKATQGGYYTQDDIKEIVKYAGDRFVTIVPEIDVPGHSMALIVSYPNLSCTQIQYPVKGNPLEIFRNDNSLCIANDSTWLILDKIFTQVADLFPGEYIHVGGDEANRRFWMKDPKDIALMKKEGITTPAGLQSYFEKKLEKLIVSKDKKMIGWDEILEGGVASEATVMSWRGMEGGIKAAQMKHHVVMTPMKYAYLDYSQGDPLVEPVARHSLRLSTCYEFEPAPEDADPQYILGGQGNLWTENIPNERQAEYMTWPRSMALAEVFWSPKDKRHWPDFVRRMEWRFKYMDIAKVKYARSAYDPIINAVKNSDGSLKVKLSTEIPGLDIYYTFDGTDPDNFYPEYQGKLLDVPQGATQIRVVTYREGKPIGHQINCPLVDLKKRIVEK